MTTRKHIRPMQLYRGILCLLVALSFLGTLAPIAGASKDKSTMPCCVGKAAGHCDSGIAPKIVPPPKSEPMCGLDNSEAADDPNTIVAEPSHNESHHSQSAAESTALSQPCPMDCGACTTSSQRQQRRERTVPKSIAYHHPPVTVNSRFQHQPFSFSANEDWEQTSPRGPPTNLL